MHFSPRIRTMMGFISIGVYGLIGVLLWPRARWATAVCGVLVVVRLVLMMKQWPRRRVDP
jgi:hypothetical protein